MKIHIPEFCNRWFWLGAGAALLAPLFLLFTDVLPISLFVYRFWLSSTLHVIIFYTCYVVLGYYVFRKSDKASLKRFVAGMASCWFAAFLLISLYLNVMAAAKYWQLPNRPFIAASWRSAKHCDGSRQMMVKDLLEQQKFVGQSTHDVTVLLGPGDYYVNDSILAYCLSANSGHSSDGEEYLVFDHDASGKITKVNID